MDKRCSKFILLLEFRKIKITKRYNFCQLVVVTLNNVKLKISAMQSTHVVVQPPRRATW